MYPQSESAYGCQQNHITDNVILTASCSCRTTPHHRWKKKIPSVSGGLSHKTSRMVHSTTVCNLPWLLAAGPLPRWGAGRPLPLETLGLCVRYAVSCTWYNLSGFYRGPAIPSVLQNSKTTLCSYRRRERDPLLCCDPLCHLATKAWPRLCKHFVEATSTSLQPTCPQGTDMQQQGWGQFQGMGEQTALQTPLQIGSLGPLTT